MSEDPFSPEHQPADLETWAYIHDQFQKGLESATTVLVTFPDTINSYPEGWTGRFMGTVVDVGVDKGGHWVDMRIVEFTKENSAEVTQQQRKIREDRLRRHQAQGVPTDEARIREILDSHTMSESVHRLVGDVEDMPLPEDVMRFYAHQLGKYPFIAQI